MSNVNYITANIDGLDSTFSVDADGKLGFKVVSLTADEAYIVLNRVREGYWHGFDNGVVINWSRKPESANHYVDQVVKYAHDGTVTTTYRTVRDDAASTMFLLVRELYTGHIQFVDDMLSATPFVTNFNDGRIYDITDAGQRVFLNTVVKAFKERVSLTHDIVVVWAKVKD